MKQLFKFEKKQMNVLKILFVLAVGMMFGTTMKPNTASAAASYQIKINKQANCVTIYKQNDKGEYKPVKALICSTGYATKLGTYSLGQKMRWHVLDGPCYGQYCTRIYGGVLFHSVWYTGENNPATLSISSYNKLGTTASHGCVRLTVAGAKWIYQNVPSGTPVIIYSAKKPGPLGKPSAIKLPGGVAWDPTDTDNPSNPWNKKKPSITGAKSQKLAFGAKYNVLKGIKAKNTTGFDAKKLMKVTILYNGEKVKKVNTKKPGTYKITYKLVDEINRKAVEKIKIKIAAPKKTPEITGVKDVYVTSKSKLTKKFMLKHVTVKQNNKKLASKYVTVKLKKLKNNVYQMVYTAQNESVAAVAKAKAYIDTSAPVISGVANGATVRVDKTTVVDKAYAKSLILSVKDNYTALTVNHVAITVTPVNAGASYQINYKIADTAGNATSVTITVVPTDYVTITGNDTVAVNASALGCDSTTDANTVKEKLTAYLLTSAGYKATTYQGTDLTAGMTVVLTETSTGVYTATFTAKDSLNHTASKNVTITVSMNA